MTEPRKRNHNHMARLSPDEVQRVREIVDSAGLDEACKVLGIFSFVTVLKAYAALEVQLMTVETVRRALARIDREQHAKVG